MRTLNTGAAAGPIRLYARSCLYVEHQANHCEDVSRRMVVVSPRKRLAGAQIETAPVVIACWRPGVASGTLLISTNQQDALSDTVIVVTLVCSLVAVLVRSMHFTTLPSCRA